MQTEIALSQSALDDVDARGFAFYQSVLKDALERDHLGEIVAVHPGSSDYAVGSYRLQAVRALREKQPTGLVFITRIGPPTSADLSVIDRVDHPIK